MAKKVILSAGIVATTLAVMPAVAKTNSKSTSVLADRSFSTNFAGTKKKTANPPPDDCCVIYYYPGGGISAVICWC